MSIAQRTISPPPLHPEIRSVVRLTLAHAHKIYFSGQLIRRVERQPDGQKPPKDEGWTEVWAQLGGTTLSIWDMKEIQEASRHGKEVPPTYLNVADAFVQVLGSVTIPASATQPSKRYTNVITLNTAGSNLFLFSCPSITALVSWASALRLSAWEKSRLEEIYTAHLIRITLNRPNAPTTLIRGRMEGWVRIRVAGQTDWKRVWMVIQSGQPELTTSPSNITDNGNGVPHAHPPKKKRIPSFFSRDRSPQYPSDPIKPIITMYAGQRPKERKKPLLSFRDVTQAFAIYPERPELISKSTLIKIEGLLGDEEIAQSMKSRVGWFFLMPDIQGASENHALEMLKWVIAIHDAFDLYGRPTAWTWDPRAPISMMFAYPVGSQRDLLFLDREDAETMDPRDDRTSMIRSRLHDLLTERMRRQSALSAKDKGNVQRSQSTTSSSISSTGASGSGIIQQPVKHTTHERAPHEDVLPALSYLKIMDDSSTSEMGPISPTRPSGSGDLQFKSSFASTRKAKAHAEQVAHRAATYKSGPADDKEKLGAAGAWIDSTDDEDEEDEEEEDEDSDSDLDRMTKAFPPQGLLSAGLQDQRDRSAKRQEELALETGAPLINVSNNPPPPQTGLLNAILAHEKERRGEGSVGVALTVQDREKRLAEERQRRFDDQQRQQFEQMQQQGAAGSMYGYPSFDPMMGPKMMGMPMNRMMTGQQNRQDSSAHTQEDYFRETGASFIKVPNKPPPPQTGLLAAITAHERERNREGGIGAVLTEREREKRFAQERQRRLDEYQRQQLDQMQQHGTTALYGYPGFNPMMNPNMMGMPIMLSGPQDNQDIPVQRQEPAIEMGTSLIEVPNTPLTPYTDFVGTITEHSTEGESNGESGNDMHQDNVELYRQCTALVMEMMATVPIKKLILELRDDKAQAVADLLSKIVDDEGTFTQRERKHTLHLLSKLAKSAQVFPQSLELKGVQCNLMNPVAAGGYGFIYKGEHHGSPICVKAVQADSRGIDREKLRWHASELILWAHLLHPNILPFLGMYPSTEEMPRMCIVSPWMDNGDLPEYLRKIPDTPRKPLVRDIISGLQYLHDFDIIHADLKAKNVLVSETGRAMLADFGISRVSMTQTITSANVAAGTAYWMAPELLLDNAPPSRQGDIWAFACTCYEIITGTTPYGQYLSAPPLIRAFMKGDIRPVKPTPGNGWDEDVWSVAMRCWELDPASRPKAHELFDMTNNFDDHSSDPKSQRRRNRVKLDYDRILSILDEICRSPTMLKVGRA